MGGASRMAKIGVTGGRAQADLIHFIGKDNIVFHCIIILLKEHGGYNLPTNVPANGFMNLEGDKISTSRNWAVWVTEYLEDFPKAATQCVSHDGRKLNKRTANSRRIVTRSTTSWPTSWATLNRVLVLTRKYYEGAVPEAPADEALDATDRALLETLAAAQPRLATSSSTSLREAKPKP